MTTAVELRARLEADLRTYYMITQADRPDGLTASQIGHCTSFAARSLLGEPRGRSDDVWRALRGQMIHDGVDRVLAEVDAGFKAGNGHRFTWRPDGLPEVTGAYDFILDTVMVEVKTRSRDECRYHADHGPSHEHAMQAAIAATAEGCPEAAVLYLPTDGGFEEAAVCMVNVALWVREAEHWLRQADVRGDVAELVARGVPEAEARRRVLDGVPRDQPLSWCRLLCDRVADCRGDYQAPVDLEIVDPTRRTAAQEAEHWRSVRLDAERREKAAKRMLEHTEGEVHDEPGSKVVVRQQHVKATEERRGHTKTKVERRPD